MNLRPLASSLLLLPALLQGAETPAAAKWTEPAVVEPKYDGVPVPPPAGALILFDGQDASSWKQLPNPKDKAAANDAGGDAVRWKIESGYLEVVPKTGMIGTRQPVLTSGRLHIEWATPADVKGNGQGRGNSGVFIEGFPEVQVLDSFDNKTYFDGQAAALYKVRPPLVNACRGPGLWQCYDIDIRRAKVEAGKVVEPATISVTHNGVRVQDKVAFPSALQAGTLKFQDHGNPVRFRNIWFQPSAD
jgi:hypothetical protein